MSDTKFEVDNPGKGNCAFYSFAIGLIDIIKHENYKFGCSPTLNQIHAKLPSSTLNLPSIINFNYTNQNYTLLNAMQKELREILFAYRKDLLLENYDKLSATDTYNNFIYMIDNCMNNRSTSSAYNELAKSHELRNYAKITAKIISEIEDPSEKEANRLSIIDEVFKKDIYNVNANFVSLNPNSLIVKAMEDIKVNFRWGIHNDVNDLARIFKVNLHTLENGRMKYTVKDDKSRPTIVMNNKYKVHWTTKISFISPCFQGKRYTKCTKDSTLTKKEVADVMKSYIHGFMALTTPRHHRAKALEIISKCNQPNISLEKILNELNKYCNNTNFDANSSFKKRCNYIMARSMYFNGEAVNFDKIIPSELEQTSISNLSQSE